MREWRQPFGYEYEVVFPGIRRLFIGGGAVVLAAEKDGTAYLVLDEGSCVDFNAPDFEETMDSLVTILEFRHACERVQYLNDNYGRWRDRLESDWVGPGVAVRRKEPPTR